MKKFISKFSLSHSDMNLDEVSQPTDNALYNNMELIDNRFSEDEVVREVPIKKNEYKNNYDKKDSDFVGSIFGEGVSIHGSISATSNVKIYGFVDGDVTTEGDVVICGRVNGIIKAINVILTDSEVRGDIYASSSVIQNKNSVVTGNISTAQLDIAGVVNGDMKVSESIAIRNTAEIIGNIETKFISVFEGAAISSQVSINK